MFRSPIALLIAAVVSTHAISASAQEFRATLEDLLRTHERIKAAEFDLAATKEGVETSRAAWYPSVDATASYGWEEQRKGQGTADTSMPPRVLTVTLSQLVWDFGASNASIDRSRLEVSQSTASLEAARQGLLLDAISAHLNVVRQRQLLNFNQGSIENVKRQMQLEDARVARGSGLATDVLQAKRQLAGLEATRTRIKGALRNALNRYRAVFGQEPPAEGSPNATEIPELPLDRLPGSMDDAITVALEENPGLKATYLGTLISKKDVRETEASEFYPEINASAEQNLKRDEGGTVGGKQETLLMIEMTYSFDLAYTKRNTLNAAKFTEKSGISRLNEERDLIEEQVRNAWDGLETARTRTEQLENQSNIASEFLELARKERQLGNRSLIDVLAGETALINATSDAASARVDVAQAVFQLLSAMGRLNTDVIN